MMPDAVIAGRVAGAGPGSADVGRARTIPWGTDRDVLPASNLHAVGGLVRGPMLVHKAEEEGVALAVDQRSIKD